METSGQAPDIASAETLVREYIALWNEGDITTIWDRIYGRDGTRLPWDEPTMRAARARLDAEDFDRSDILSLSTRATDPDFAETRIRFVRLRRDGSAIPPGPYESLYTLRFDPGGWRIIEMRPAT
jgi:hypothetical protein